MMHRFITCLLVFIFSYVFVFGQEPIYLENPSFEDMPRHSRQPRGWYDCGYPGESPPDTQPGQFDVTQLPHDGDSYLGLVVRENETWERVSQQLSAPLEAGKCYEFSIYLSRSELYLSPTKADSLSMKNHISPIKLRIWGGSGWCTRGELLAESSLVINMRWLEYNFKFEPKETHSSIILEAFYRTPTLFLYNGNILIDDASPIIPVDCDDPDAPTLADNTPIEEPKPAPKTTPKPQQSPIVDNTPPKTGTKKTGHFRRVGQENSSKRANHSD